MGKKRFPTSFIVGDNAGIGNFVCAGKAKEILSCF